MNRGLELAKANNPVAARSALSQALAADGLLPAEADRVRQVLGELNQRLVFSAEIVEGDPFVRGHVVASGETFERITSRQKLRIEPLLLSRINKIDPKRLPSGKKIKLVQGPFHAVVSKSDYRLDLYLGEGNERVFVTSMPIGLGENDATPLGMFKVRPASKLINPAWIDPRTGEKFAGGDPKNPIGHRWLGIQGIEPANRELAGYGIHGTVEPNSIGQQQSMGCIRMLAADVELIYEVLVEEASTVEIRRR